MATDPNQHQEVIEKLESLQGAPSSEADKIIEDLSQHNLFTTTTPEIVESQKAVRDKINELMGGLDTNVSNQLTLLLVKLKIHDPDATIGQRDMGKNILGQSMLAFADAKEFIAVMRDMEAYIANPENQVTEGDIDGLRAIGIEVKNGVLATNNEAGMALSKVERLAKEKLAAQQEADRELNSVPFGVFEVPYVSKKNAKEAIAAIKKITEAVGKKETITPFEAGAILSAATALKESELQSDSDVMAELAALQAVADSKEVRESVNKQAEAIYEAVKDQAAFKNYGKICIAVRSSAKGDRAIQLVRNDLNFGDPEVAKKVTRVLQKSDHRFFKKLFKMSIGELKKDPKKALVLLVQYRPYGIRPENALEEIVKVNKELAQLITDAIAADETTGPTPGTGKGPKPDTPAGPGSAPADADADTKGAKAAGSKKTTKKKTAKKTAAKEKAPAKERPKKTIDTERGKALEKVAEAIKEKLSARERDDLADLLRITKMTFSHPENISLKEVAKSRVTTTLEAYEGHPEYVDEFVQELKKIIKEIGGGKAIQEVFDREKAFKDNPESKENIKGTDEYNKKKERIMMLHLRAHKDFFNDIYTIYELDASLVEDAEQKSILKDVQRAIAKVLEGEKLADLEAVELAEQETKADDLKSKFDNIEKYIAYVLENVVSNIETAKKKLSTPISVPEVKVAPKVEEKSEEQEEEEAEETTEEETGPKVDTKEKPEGLLNLNVPQISMQEVKNAFGPLLYDKSLIARDDPASRAILTMINVNASSVNMDELVSFLRDPKMPVTPELEALIALAQDKLEEQIEILNDEMDDIKRDIRLEEREYHRKGADQTAVRKRLDELNQDMRTKKNEVNLRKQAIKIKNGQIEYESTRSLLYMVNVYIERKQKGDSADVIDLPELIANADNRIRKERNRLRTTGEKVAGALNFITPHKGGIKEVLRGMANDEILSGIGEAKLLELATIKKPEDQEALDKWLSGIGNLETQYRQIVPRLIAYLEYAMNQRLTTRKKPVEMLLRALRKARNKHVHRIVEKQHAGKDKMERITAFFSMLDEYTIDENIINTKLLRKGRLKNLAAHNIAGLAAGGAAFYFTGGLAGAGYAALAATGGSFLPEIYKGTRDSYKWVEEKKKEHETAIKVTKKVAAGTFVTAKWATWIGANIVGAGIPWYLRKKKIEKMDENILSETSNEES